MTFEVVLPSNSGRSFLKIIIFRRDKESLVGDMETGGLFWPEENESGEFANKFRQEIKGIYFDIKMLMKLNESFSMWLKAPFFFSQNVTDKFRLDSLELSFIECEDLISSLHKPCFVCRYQGVGKLSFSLKYVVDQTCLRQMASGLERALLHFG